MNVPTDNVPTGNALTNPPTDLPTDNVNIGAETAADLQSAEAEHQKMMEESEKMPEKSQEMQEMTQKIRADASAKYSQEELDRVINMGKMAAGKAVLCMLISVIEEGPDKGFSADECKKLVKLVQQRIPYDYCMPIQCEFAETDYKLNICLTLTDRNYKAEISVPDASYAGDLYKQYNFLKSIATAYWQQFVEDYNALFRRICQYRSDVNFSVLVVDEANPTTLYFDPASKKRVGIFPYYVDAQGRPLTKRK